MQSTGEEEIDKLTSHFVKQEEENFALFNYVNELNDELEGLQSRVAQLRSAIDEARALNVHRGNQQAETLEKISKQLEEQTSLANEAENNLTEVIIIIFIVNFSKVSTRNISNWSKSPGYRYLTLKESFS